MIKVMSDYPDYFKDIIESIVRTNFEVVYLERRDKVKQLISYLGTLQTNVSHYSQHPSNIYHSTKLMDKPIIYSIEQTNQFIDNLKKYKQFKDIDNDFTIQKYNIDLKSNTINHLTFQDKEYKFCSQCNQWNLIDLYHAYKSSVDGLYKYCKSCSKDLKKQSEETNSTTKNWKENNKEKVAEYNKKYREQNREKLLEKSRKAQEDKDNLIKNRKNKYYEEFKNKCSSHEGKLLSPEEDYDTAHTKLRVRCKQNHEFEISWNNCNNNKWCKQCRK